MKNLLKKLAFVMAFALVLTSLAPAASASAAAEMKINLASKILYLGGSDLSKTKAEYDFSISNKPSNYSSLYTFKWTSSKPSVATVNNSGLTKAVTTGTTTITCTITGKKTGKVVAKPTTAVTVKANAGAVSIKIKGNPDQRIAKVGEVVDFDRTMTSKTGKGTATDKTKWIFVENSAKAVVKQSNGQVNATTPGTYTIIAYTYQSSSYPLGTDKYGNYVNYTAVSDPITITVTENGTKPTPTPTPTPAPSEPVIAQQSMSSFKMITNTDIRSIITKDTLSIRDRYGIAQIVKNITYSEGGKTALVELWNEMENKGVYTVTYGSTVLTFTASAGEVKGITVTGIKDSGNRVAVGEPGTILYELRDANNIVVPLPNTGYVSFEVLNDNYDAFISGDQISLFTVGKTATIVATYHTNDYISTGNGTELVYKSNPFTVSCTQSVAPEVSSVVASTIASTHVGSSVDWTKPVMDVSLSDEGSLYLVVKAVNTSGKTVYLSNFESTNASKLIVDPTTGQLFPIAVGQYDVLCKTDDGRVVGTVRVTVKDYRKASTISASNNSLTLSNSSSINDSATVTVYVKDQYGKDLNVDSVEVTKLNTNLNGYLTAEGIVSSNRITFNGSSAQAGTYTYRLTVNGKSTTVNIVVRDTNSNSSVSTYRLSADTNVMDMKVTSTTSANRSITLYLNGYNSSGVKVSAERGVTVYVTGPNNYSKEFTTGENGAVSIPVVKDGKKLLTTGAYRVTASKIGQKVVAPASFSITDSQPKPSVSFTKTKFEVASGTYVYDEIIKNLAVSSNSGASSITVQITDDCVITTDAIKNGVCYDLGTFVMAVKKLIVTESFGDNQLTTTITLSNPEALTFVVK